MLLGKHFPAQGVHVHLGLWCGRSDFINTPPSHPALQTFEDMG